MEASRFRLSRFWLSTQHNLASVLVQLRDLCPPWNLEVSDILLPKKT